MHPHERERLLAEHGWLFIRQCGSHRRYVHVASGAHLTISAHSHAMSPHLLRVIERQGRRLVVTQESVTQERAG